MVTRRFVVAGIVAAFALALAVVGVLAAGLGRDASSEAPAAPVPGAASVGAAADASLTTFAGERFRLRDHAGGPVFVYFWASWCEPCKAEAQLIQRLAPEYLAQGYTFVGVNIWDGEADARAFAQRYGLTFPLVRDADGALYLPLAVERLPMAFFLRPGLEIERRVLGELREPELRAALASIGGRS